MATPKSIKVGSNARLNFGTVDNYIAVYLNPDNSGIGGWAKVFEFDTAGLGTPNPQSTVDLDDVLNYFRKNTRSVTMAVVASNYAGGGEINFTFSSTSGKESVHVNLPTYTSQQWSYTLHL